MSRFYGLDWDWFETKMELNGWMAFVVYGGIVLRKPGYKPILCDHSEPEMRIVTESEVEGLVL